MKLKLTFRFTPGRIALLAVGIAGLIMAIYRFWVGLGPSTNLTDSWPWGFWIGYIMFCVALAGGAFSTAAIVDIFNLKQFQPLLRPAIVMGFLGYLLVIAGLIVELGRPWNIWRPIFYWQHHSVMFEIAWCVMLYTTVLALEFAPMVFERLRNEKAEQWLRRVEIVLVSLGIILSTLHQSSLGTLFLIVPQKLHALWYTPLLPVFYFISSVMAGLAMVVVVTCLAARACRRRLDSPLLSRFSKGLPYVLLVYLAAKIADLVARGAWAELFNQSFESRMYLAEIGIGVILPMFLLSRKKLRDHTPWLFAASALVAGGVVFNRINMALTGMAAASHGQYIPSLVELGISAGLISLGILAYFFIVENFPVFPEDQRIWRERTSETAAQKQGLMEKGHSLPAR